MVKNQRLTPLLFVEIFHLKNLLDFYTKTTGIDAKLNDIAPTVIFEAYLETLTLDEKFSKTKG